MTKYAETEDQFGHDLNPKLSQLMMNNEKLPNFRIALVREGAIFEKAHPDDAAYDVKVFAREIKDKYIKYMLGIKSVIPIGYKAMVYHRSSNSDKDGIIANLVGTIDAGFRGEWQARVKVLRQPTLIRKMDYIDDTTDIIENIYFDGFSNSAEKINVWENGEKALQVVFEKILPHTLEFIQEEQITDSDRGSKGHGSSGK